MSNAASNATRANTSTYSSAPRNDTTGKGCKAEPGDIGDLIARLARRQEGENPSFPDSPSSAPNQASSALTQDSTTVAQSGQCPYSVVRRDRPDGTALVWTIPSWHGRGPSQTSNPEVNP